MVWFIFLVFWIIDDSGMCVSVCVSGLLLMLMIVICFGIVRLVIRYVCSRCCVCVLVIVIMLMGFGSVCS